MRTVLDASAVQEWCRTSVDQLARARHEIDDLNVFPVPDGDTGTNLFLTMEAAAAALRDEAGAPAQGRELDLAAAVRALAHGAMLGARGNSGVILAQLLRGLAEPLAQASPAAPPDALRASLRHAADLAYQAVSRPVEGTVLTVARAAAEAAEAEPADHLGAIASAAWSGAVAALRQTPDQLEALRRAGVVDAGGRGLVVLLDALAAIITGRAPEQLVARLPHRSHAADPVISRSAYEVMFLLDASQAAVDDLRAVLDKQGDSLVVVGGEGLWNVHVHVDEPGPVIEAAIEVGRPHRITITHLAATGAPHPVTPAVGGKDQSRSVVAVTAGTGLAELFTAVGAHVVAGGPGHRPSTSDILTAVCAAAAPDSSREVIVLPNDADTLAVAEAAVTRAAESGVRAYVVPTRATVQGLAAMAVHDPSRRSEDDVVAMTAAAMAMRHGEVSVAVREAFTSAGRCQAGDALGLIDDDVVIVTDNLAAAAVAVVDLMLAGAGELVTLVVGADAPSGLSDAVRAHLHESRPDVEVNVYQGEQDVYPLLIGVE